MASYIVGGCGAGRWERPILTSLSNCCEIKKQAKPVSTRNYSLCVYLCCHQKPTFGEHESKKMIEDPQTTNIKTEYKEYQEMASLSNIATSVSHPEKCFRCEKDSECACGDW